MQLLAEPEIRRDLRRLSAVWEEEPTFVLLPEKLPVDSSWIHQEIGRLPDEAATNHYVLLTSGTTGHPKLVVGNRARSESLAAVLHHCQESEAVQETILVLPLSYSFAFVNQWLWSKVHGRKLILTTGLKDPNSLSSILLQARNAMICLVGVQVPLLADLYQGQVFPGIIRVHFAGGRFPQENLAAVRTLFPRAEIYNNYGCAEALPRLSLRRAEDASDAANIGRPLPGIELMANEHEELLFRSRYSAIGIVEDGAYSPISSDTWVKTGDLGRAMEQGSWRLIGRPSEVFKRHGEKISLPVLLTTVFRSWPGQAAFYREQDRRGESGHVLVLAPSPKADELKTILMSFRHNHSRAHWPLRVESTPAIPLLSNGKPDVRGIATAEDKMILWRQTV